MTGHTVYNITSRAPWLYGELLVTSTIENTLSAAAEYIAFNTSSICYERLDS